MHNISLPVVSVIIPNYNHASYLQKRIDSVLGQTYSGMEVIVLDDYSTDNSKDIIENFRNHPKVSHIVLNTENSGSPFVQWQRGFLLAKGDYIWVAESDDYAAPDFLEKLMLPLQKNTKVGVSYCDSNIVDESEIKYDFYKGYRNSAFHTTKWNKSYTELGIDEIKFNLFFDCTINNTSSMIFKKKLLDFVDFEKLSRFKYSGDWYFFISIVRHTSIAYTSSALNFFRVGANNFKGNARSGLNHFKERSLVRYLLWNEIQLNFTLAQKRLFFKQIGTELRIQMNLLIKHKNKMSELIDVLQLLHKTNKLLFRKQFLFAIRGYIWKN